MPRARLAWRLSSSLRPRACTRVRTGLLAAFLSTGDTKASLACTGDAKVSLARCMMGVALSKNAEEGQSVLPSAHRHSHKHSA